MENKELRSDLLTLVGRPIKLIPSVFQHMYNGGKLRAEFLGEEDPKDDFRPEEWLLSTTQASTPGRENPLKEGYCMVETSSGLQAPIETLIGLFPHETVGDVHFQSYGTDLGILVKIFDVGEDERIPIHWHPTPAFAQKHLHSPNGKNEAWIIMGVRDQGTAWVGWKEEIPKDVMINLIESKSTETIRSYMHEINLKVGDVLSLPAGIVHAIGSGVCVLEPQEPTDFSIIAEYGRFAVTEEECHLGLGWDLVLESADMGATDRAELLAEISPVPGIAYNDGLGTIVESILSLNLDSYFWANRVTVATQLLVPGLDVFTAPGMYARFHSMTVLNGEGTLSGSFDPINIRKGESYFIPVSTTYGIKCTSDDNLEAIRCYPPRPKALGVSVDEPES